MNKKSVDALRNIADEAIKPKTQLSRKARSTLSPPKEGAADKTRKRPRKHGAVRPDDMATAQLAAAALPEESTQAQVESAQTPENNAIVQFVIEKAEVPEVPESQVAQSTHDAETAVKDKEETEADEEVEEPVEPGMSEEELHELVHQIGPALSPSGRNKKIGVVIRGLVLQCPAVKKAILSELESHVGVASDPMRKLLAQYENEAFVARIIHSTPDREEQAGAVAEGLTERYVIWSLNLLTGGLKNASFAVWYEEEWHLLTPQEMIVTMGLANLNAKMAKEILYFISTMAPVQGPPASGEVGFCVGLLNGRFDFATGQLRGARPEDKLLNRLGRRYLLPSERVPANENRFYRMLDVYAPGVSRMAKQSMLPRIIAPWPGGKHIYLVGTSGTGKNVYIAMCRRLVDSQVSNVVGKRKSDSHATTRLDNAFFNFTSEAKRVPIKNLERWKDEADREIFEVNPKGKSGYMARYMCTSIAAANLLPPLPVFGSEIWRRILVIPFLRRLKGVAGLGDDKMQIPEHRGHRFRSIVDTDSGASWTPIPEHRGQHSGASWTALVKLRDAFWPGHTLPGEGRRHGHQKVEDETNQGHFETVPAEVLQLPGDRAGAGGVEVQRPQLRGAV